MVISYDPGAPSPYFPRHEYEDIPVGGSTLSGEILSAERLWGSFQAEAEDLLRTGDGRWITDDRERNRRINRAYARLWLADRRFQWAGLAAFASKQVGCGLPHAADVIDARRRERERIEHSLGHGSAHVFLDIYPLHRFYMERGWDEFQACLPARRNARYAVHWDVDRATLPFAASFPEMALGFAQIERGRTPDSVRTLAQHEQVNILQTIMYDSAVMQLLLDWNQLAWAIAFPSGDYQAITLSLSAQCPARAAVSSTFSKKRYAKLWDPAERMPFVFDAADRIDELLSGPECAQVEASIRTIAGGTGLA